MRATPGREARSTYEKDRALSALTEEHEQSIEGGVGV